MIENGVQTPSVIPSSGGGPPMRGGYRGRGGPSLRGSHFDSRGG